MKHSFKVLLAIACLCAAEAVHTQSTPCPVIAGEKNEDLINIVKANDNSYDADCLGKAKSELKSRARVLLNEIDNLTTAKQAEKKGTPSYSALNNKITSDETDLEEIIEAGIALDQLINGFQDYPNYYYYFFGGYEFNSVANTFYKGFPTAGLRVYQKSSDRTFSWHIFGSISLTSSAEQTASTQASKLPAGGAKALQFDIDNFVPIYEENLGDYSDLVGPIVDLGARKTDTIPQFDIRKYIGVRSAINPDLYLDILWGKTDSLPGKRWELRGDLPVYATNGGSKIYIGAIANLRATHTTVPDTFVIYAVWNVPFSTVTSLGSP